MDDLISRQAALEKIRTMQTYKLFSGDDMILVDKAEVQTELMALLPIQPEQQWIPVTERLPEVKQAVLVTTKNGQRDIRKCIDAGHLTWFYHDILAWMPLPEPYRKE